MRWEKAGKSAGPGDTLNASILRKELYACAQGREVERERARESERTRERVIGREGRGGGEVGERQSKRDMYMQESKPPYLNHHGGRSSCGGLACRH